MAAKVELMIIVGDKNSSNTKKLYTISKKINKNTIFVENKSDLSLKDIEKYNRIGVARSKGLDVKIETEVPLAKDLAERLLDRKSVV